MKHSRVAYHRISDNSVSSSPVPTVEQGIEEATRNLRSPDIDHVWVRDATNAVVFSDNELVHTFGPNCLACAAKAAELNFHE